MKHHVPKSPLSTGLSGSAKEVELRVKNILRGQRKRPALALMGAVVLMVALSGVVVACYSPENTGKVQVALEASYEESYGDQVYWTQDQPDQPQVGDVRLESMTLLGEADLEGAVGQLYEVTKCIYGQQNGSAQWVTMEPGLEVLTVSEDGSVQVLGAPNFPTEGLTREQIIRQTVWGLLAWEVSLWREGHDRPIGIGTPVSHIMEWSDGQEVIEVMGAGYSGPIYQEGDWYELHSWPALTVNCYHTQADDRCSANHITCEHPDLVTPRGIHVGSARSEVQEAYPEATNEPYWDWQGDYLCYQPWEGEFGPAILFVFQVGGEVYDTVQAIFLVNMVN